MPVPIILITTWHVALHLMCEGYWATRIKSGTFIATFREPKSGPMLRIVSRRGMFSLIRHGYECTHYARSWVCIANQIG
jgi:hypothetical protein